MAFGIQAISGSTTISLTDNNPFGLISTKGLSGAASRRVAVRGPMQHGETDTGYRLSPREIELVIGFKAATDALLDASRDSLHSIFKPLSSTPVTLKLTRDDGAIRQLDCYLVGDIDIRLDPALRPGHYHRATVRLYAPDPRYYNPTPGTVTVTGTAGTAADWYLAGGAIGTASVLMSGGTPTQGQAWSYTGTITNSYTLAFRSQQETYGAAAKFAFQVNNGNGVGSIDPALWVEQIGGPASFYHANGTAGYTIGLGTVFMPAGTVNYFLRYDVSGGLTNGPFGVFRAGTAEKPLSGVSNLTPMPVAGAARRWRSDSANNASSRWSNSLLLYALYSPGLSDAQIVALDTYMAGGVGGTIGTYLSVPYLGDLIEYPVISIRGPITGPYLTNIVTDQRLTFTGVTIGAGTTYVIDTRPGLQNVMAGTVSKLEDLDGSSQLGNFYLSPDSGNNGVNSILLTGTNTSGSTQMSVVWSNRYSSM